MKRLLLVLAILCIATSAFAGVGKINNGGFTTTANNWISDYSTWGASNIKAAFYNTAGGVHFPMDGTTTLGVLGLSYGGSGGFNSWVYQQITGLVIGQEYKFTADYGGGVGDVQALPSNSTAWWEVGLVAGAYNKNAVDNSVASSVVDKTEFVGTRGGFGWKTVTRTFVATDTTYTAYLKQGWVNGNYNYFGAYYDNVKFEAVVPVPEPSSLLALGTGAIGLLGLIRRRK